MENKYSVDLVFAYPMLDEMCDIHRDWALDTFGPLTEDKRKGLLKHLRKELDEIEKDSSDPKEWADVMILAIHGMFTLGLGGSDVVETYMNKMIENFEREWPDWRTADPTEPLEHVRE